MKRITKILVVAVIVSLFTLTSFGASYIEPRPDFSPIIQNM